MQQLSVTIYRGMPKALKHLGLKGGMIGLNEAAFYYENGDDGTFGAFREIDSGSITILDAKTFANAIGIKHSDNIVVGLKKYLEPVNSERERIMQIREICDKNHIPYRYIEEAEEGKIEIEKT